jgi:hypothetical protein
MAHRLPQTQACCPGPPAAGTACARCHIMWQLAVVMIVGTVCKAAQSCACQACQHTTLQGKASAILLQQPYKAVQPCACQHTTLQGSAAMRMPAHNPTRQCSHAHASTTPQHPQTTTPLCWCCLQCLHSLAHWLVRLPVLLLTAALAVEG